MDNSNQIAKQLTKDKMSLVKDNTTLIKVCNTLFRHAAGFMDIDKEELDELIEKVGEIKSRRKVK